MVSNVNLHPYNSGATDEQCEFPVVYASGFQGIAGMEPDEMSDNLEPLFDTIISEVPAPVVDAEVRRCRLNTSG